MWVGSSSGMTCGAPLGSVVGVSTLSSGTGMIGASSISTLSSLAGCFVWLRLHLFWGSRVSGWNRTLHSTSTGCSMAVSPGGGVDAAVLFWLESASAKLWSA